MKSSAASDRKPTRKRLQLSVQATRLRIKVKRVKNRTAGAKFGDAWLVVVPAKVAGGMRIRKQFPIAKSKEAVQFAEGQAGLAREHGVSAFRLTGSQSLEAAKCFRLIAESGLTLADVVVGLRHLRPEGGDKSLGEIRDLILAEKKRENLRPASLHALKTYLGALVAHFGEAKPVKGIGYQELRNWIAELEGPNARLVSQPLQPGAKVRPLTTVCTVQRGGISYDIRARTKGVLPMVQPSPPLQAPTARSIRLRLSCHRPARVTCAITSDTRTSFSNSRCRGST